MKKYCFIALAVAVAVFTGCTSTKGHFVMDMYNWYDYTNVTYNYIKNGEEDDVEALIQTYESIIYNQDGTIRETVPPGVCADYGYLQIRLGNESEGKEFLLKEKELYPESSRFVDSILKRIER